VRDGVKLAKRGLPVVSLVTEEFWEQGNFVARSLGMPDLPRVNLPHPIAGMGGELSRRGGRSNGGFDSGAIGAMTEDMDIFRSGWRGRGARAVARIAVHGWAAGGYPDARPRRLNLCFACGQDADMVIGELGPAMGLATVAKSCCGSGYGWLQA
jgi:hypothetical protein